MENLHQFLAAAHKIQPLPADIVEEITRLHNRWSNELDMKAVPVTFKLEFLPC